jgi:aminopeptidase N
VNRPRGRAVLVALLAGLLVASACSGDDVLTRDGSATTSSADNPATTTTNDATTTAPPTREGADGDGVAGDAGIGDPYFPLLGNGGYDVTRYDLEFTIDGADGSDVAAAARITATATEDLDTFDLDFWRHDIERVEVDGRTAAHRLDGEELVIDPEPVLREGATFVVDVRYRGRFTPVPGAGFGDLGWQQVGGVTFVSDEPFGAHSWFPSNDHPSDKAAFGITITVPDGTTAVATGTLVSRTSSGGRTTSVWDHPDPIPTYVVALAFGDLRIVESDGPHGIGIRHAFPRALADRAITAFADTADLVTDLEELFGPYPFDTYGVLVVDGELGYAMENQTLVLYPRSILDGSQFSQVTVVHELAHHWFGNWVSPASWDETWLNEGFAAYAEQLWLEHTTAGYDIDGAMRRIAARGHGQIGDPGVRRMFSEDVYQRGALTLHALRRTMGDAGFFQLLRLWCDRYGGSSATSEDLAALASEVAGQDLHAFFAQWLDGATTPPLPS